MNFHEFTTIYDVIKRSGLADVPVEEWYKSEIERTMVQAISMARQGEESLTPVIGNMQMAVELDWEKAKRPYYKIFPKLLPYFVDTKLDVPSEFFKLPFPSFLVRLPEQHSVDCLKIDDNYYVRSILVGGTEKGTPSLIFGGDGNPAEEIDDYRQVIIFIDINEFEGEKKIPVLTYQQLLFEDEKQTAEEALLKHRAKARFVENGMVNHGGIPVPVSLTEACLRVAVAVTFLATGGDKIVECDVLNRDLVRYLEAKKKEDKETQERLAGRAKRNHKHGFTLGREISLPGTSSGGQSTGEGHELQYQHQRSAHWHWVRHGPGRAKMKLMFFGQTTVRPDLPANPNARRGYKTKN